MSQNAKQPFTLNGRTRSNQNHNSQSDSLIEREPIEGTPFQAIKENEKWFLAWGNYKLTENRKTKKEAVKLLKTNLWDIIAVYVLSIIAQTDKAKQQEMIKQIEE